MLLIKLASNQIEHDICLSDGIHLMHVLQDGMES